MATQKETKAAVIAADSKAGKQYDSDDSWDYECHKGLPEDEFEENLDYLKTHPLFTKQLPDDMSAHPDIEAIQHLLYNDEPVKIARHFNDKGAEYIKKGLNNYNMKEALKCYDEGLGQEFDDKNLKAKLHCNRAFLHIKYKNYGKAMLDVQDCLKNDPNYVKAYYRGATACLALHKLKGALAYCDKGLELDSESKELKTLKDQIWSGLKREEELKKKIKEYENTTYGGIMNYYKEKGYALGKRVHEIPDAYKHDPFLDNNKVLHFSVIIGYPEFSQMDFIQDARETDVIKDHMKEILKTNLPWDEDNHYTMKQIELYVELNAIAPMFPSDKHTNYQQAYIRISRKNTFQEILKVNGYVMPHLIEIIVISKTSEYYKKFKEDNEFITPV